MTTKSWDPTTTKKATHPPPRLHDITHGSGASIRGALLPTVCSPRPAPHLARSIHVDGRRVKVPPRPQWSGLRLHYRK
jgi:hypothetical protein